MSQLKNRGFVSSPTAFIRQIRTNLEEGRYERDSTGASILKELLQNADDAGTNGANFLYVGLSSGLPNAKHPLLRSPALYIINDGPFESHDEQNIKRFGENSKSLDTGKIGKFGLGLKSLFHLCEAFFYFFTIEKEGKPSLRRGFLNPWSSGDEDDIHGDWDRLDHEDMLTVFSELSPLIGQSHCFSLWIPLRQKSQLDGNQPIAQYFPGDDLPSWLAGKDLQNTLARTLPMLQHLKEVRGYMGSGKSAKQLFSIQLLDGSVRRKRVSDLQVSGTHEFNGVINSEDEEVLRYHALENRLQHPKLCELYDDSRWPQDLGRDPATGKVSQVKEKAEQHGACCLSISRSQPGEKGCLTISWAVFLPLGTATTIPLNLPFRVSILLHGYFFTDAGRNGPLGLVKQYIEPFGEDEDRLIKAKWNYRIAEIATLPLLPQVLSNSMQDLGSEEADSFVNEVTRALSETELFKDAQSAICSKFCLAHRADSTGNSSWQLLASDQRMLLLPGLPISSRLAWEVFPQLALLAEEYVVSFSDAPRLCHPSFAVVWSSDVVSRLLQEINIERLGESDEMLGYATGFIEFLNLDGASVLETAEVVDLVRKVLRRAGLDRARELSSRYRRLIRQVPQSSRIAVDLSEADCDLFQLLLEEKRSFLVIPKFLEPEGSPSSGRLDSHECVALLERLAKSQVVHGNEKQRDSSSLIAASLLALAKSKVEVVEKIGDLPLFVASDCQIRKGGETLVSWNQLNRRRESQTLFVKPPALAYQFQDALAEESLYLVDFELFGLLFPGVETKPTCRERQIFSALSRTNPPLLKGAEARKNLAEKLMDFQSRQDVAEYRACIRYLLHGSAENSKSSDVLLVNNSSIADVWRRVVEKSLAVNETRWRLLDPELASCLSPNLCTELGVQPIDANIGARLVEENKASVFSGLSPNDEEYVELLRYLRNDELCKRLPIHKTIDGRFVSIEDNCFWESTMQVPTEFSQSVTILKLSTEPDTRYRQERLTRRLDHIAIIKMAVDSGQPGQHWKLLLEALEAADNPPDSLVLKLKTAKWILTDDRSFISPDEVVHLPKLHHEVRTILASNPGIFYEPSQIGQPFLRHTGYTQLERLCFPDEETSLAMIGEVLKENPLNSIGIIPNTEFQSWLETAGDFPETVLPSARFVRKAADAYGSNVRSLITELGKGQVSVERLKQLLYACQCLHTRGMSHGVKTRILSVYSLYLGMLLQRTGGKGNLLSLELLNRDGQWITSSRLAFSNDGIAGKFVVHPVLESLILQHHEVLSVQGQSTNNIDHGLDIDWSDVHGELAATEGKLKTYFRAWENLIPPEQIGGFLSLLGDDVDVHTLAQKYLGGNRTVDQTRRKFGLEDWRDQHGSLREDGLTMIAKQRVIVEVLSTQKVTVANIFGDTIQADRNLVPSTIFINYGKPNFPFPHKVVDGKRVLCFRLNQIDTRQASPTELSRLLQDSCVKLIEQAYNQYAAQTSFEEAWEDLSNSDQLDICIAQARIISNAFLILEQYGLKSDSKLGPVIREWDSADKLIAEQSSGVSLGHGNRDANKERDVAKAKLRNLLENDADTQLRIAAAVRQRIEKHYQYTVSSIPFEIFQNADDTCSQLAAHFGDQDRIDAARSFSVFRDERKIVFTHFGRCINQYPLENADLRPKFEDDLWSMLVLNLSSKSLDDGAEKTAGVTGKYGLGFKSCYLVSDAPKVVSGRLAFEVKGAMYPKRMLDNGDDENVSILRHRDSLGKHNRHATLIELALDRADAVQVLQRFDRLSGLQVVFARHISSIVLKDGIEVSWHPSSVAQVDGAFVGRLALYESDGVTESVNGLLLRNEIGSLLLCIDSGGVTCFDSEIPTVWVTAPTDECLGTGFIVNGAFNIDVGRAQLSRDLSENEHIASCLGALLGDQLSQLFMQSQRENDWSSLVRQLGIAEGTTPYQFFTSLFEVLTNVKVTSSSEPGHKLLHDMVWRDDKSLGCVLVDCVPGLPSSLPGEYQQLVAASSVKYLLAGIIGEREDVFNVVSSWDSFRRKAPAGSVVSESRVARRLRRIQPRLLASATLLRLSDVMAWEFGETFVCDAATATRLGQLVSRQLLIESDEFDEQQEIETLLKKIKFKGRDGKFHLAVKLLCPEMFALASDYDVESGEEKVRADFAPISCLLSEDYQNEALVFFEACRGRMEAPARLMAEWTLRARDLMRQIAALKYIARGQLRRPLILELKQMGWLGTWLEHLATSQAFQALADVERLQLVELIPESDRPTFNWAFTPAAPQNPVGLPPQDCLRAVHDWWSSVKNTAQPDFQGRTFVREYEHRTYPSWFRPDTGLADSDNRESWMTLLLLGLFHTQGRATTHQHKGFLDQLRSDGWFDLFVSSVPDQLRWMKSVDKYLDDQVSDAMYLHWMRQFVGIYQLNRHVEDYAEQFLAIDRVGKAFSLDQITNSRTSTLQQGGGRDTPPLSRQLGLGACFVVRELVRTQVLNSPYTYEHCFVPTRRIRTLFSKLGCEDLEQDCNRWEASRAIHKFLSQNLQPEDSCFCNDFDIPFQFIADDVELQEELFAEPLEIEDEDEIVDATDWDAFSN